MSSSSQSELKSSDSNLQVNIETEFSESRVPLESEKDKFGAPDGGLRAWLTVAGSWLVLFGTLGYLYGFGVFQDYYTRIYLTNHSPSSISWIGSLQLMMPYFLGVFSGKLFDMGYFYALETAGCLLFTFCLFMLSLAKPDQYYQILLSQGLGMGLGLGMTFIPAVGVLSHHFKRRRGLAAGIALSGSSCGAVVFPILLNNLLQKKSFGDSVRASAYVVLACLVVGVGLMRTRLPARKASGPDAEPAPDMKGWFREGPYATGMIGGLFAAFGFFFPVIYLQLYAVQHSVDINLAFYSLAMLNASGAFGRVIGNYFSDTYGPFNFLVPCSAIVGAMIWAMAGITDRGTLVVVSVLYGLFSGAYLALVIAGLAFLSKNANEVGARTGLGVCLSSFSTLGAAPIQGALLTSNFNWLRPIAFSATMMFAASATFFVTRILLTRERQTQKV